MTDQFLPDNIDSNVVKKFVEFCKKLKFSPVELRIFEMLIKKTKRQDLSLFSAKTIKSYNITLEELNVFSNCQISEQEALTINTNIMTKCHNVNGTFNNLFVYSLFTNNEFEYGLNPFFIKDFLNLKEFFDNFNLYYLLTMKSYTSMLLYKSLREYGDLKYLELTIEELKQKLGLDNKYYQYGPLKLRVIEVALEDINNNSELNIKLTELKTRQKITKLRFSWTYKDTQEQQAKKLFAAFAKKHKKELGISSSRDVNLDNIEISNEFDIFIKDNFIGYNKNSIELLRFQPKFQE